MDLSSIKHKVTEILKEIENYEKFKTDTILTFVRTKTGYYGPHYSYTTWKILLDESKSKICVKDSQGFKLLDRKQDDQFIIAPAGTKELLLSKNKADRILASTILDSLAKEKYGE